MGKRNVLRGGFAKGKVEGGGVRKIVTRWVRKRDRWICACGFENVYVYQNRSVSR